MLRVISQDQMTDIPYDLVVIKADGCRVFAISPNTDGNSGIWKLAEYNSEEKTYAAMKRLKQRAQQVVVQREVGGLMRYADIPRAYKFPNDEELEA